MAERRDPLAQMLEHMNNGDESDIDYSSTSSTSSSEEEETSDEAENEIDEWTQRFSPIQVGIFHDLNFELFFLYSSF